MSDIAFSLILSLRGEDPTRHILFEDTVTFGRSPENEIQILVPEVSVRHGRLERDGGSYRLFDNHSTNGTEVNGKPVGPGGVLLKPMDRITVGRVVPAYFVPTAVLESTPLAQLVATLEKSAAADKPAPAPRPLSAPVAIASPSRTPGTAALNPAAGGGSIPLASPGAGAGAGPIPIASPGPAGGPKPGPAPAPAPLRQPHPLGPQAPAGPAGPVGPQVSPVSPVKSPAAGVQPLRPAPPSPIGARPSAPAGPAGPVAPSAPAGPGAPLPVPMKRPSPAAPTLPLPKKPGG